MKNGMTIWTLEEYKVEEKDRLSAAVTSRLAHTSSWGQFPAVSTAKVV